jgi:hypothetical protein
MRDAFRSTLSSMSSPPRIPLVALATALACACGEPKEPVRAVDRANDGAKKESTAPQGAVAPAEENTPAKDGSAASVRAEEPPPMAKPIFAEPTSTTPSRTVPRAVFSWSGRDEEAEDAARVAFHGSVRDEVAALVAEAAAGKPRLVTLRVGNTMNWGCGCPWFVIPDESAEYDDEFAIHLLADGVAKIDYKVNGLFRLTGHYTGRHFDTGPDPDKIGKHAYPEFHVHGWCYVPPAKPFTREYEAPEMRRMRAAGAPLCKGKTWPKWIEVTPDEKA